MASEQTHNRSIQDRRRVLNLYTLGDSYADIQAKTGIPVATAHRWCRAAGITRTVSEALEVKGSGRVWCTPALVESVRERIAAGDSFVAIAAELRIPVTTLKNRMRRKGVRSGRSTAAWRASRLDPSKPANRARLDLTAAICRLHADGLPFEAVADRLGIQRARAQRLASSPYGRALRVFVHGRATGNRAEHARAMHHRQYLPAPFIAKVLDCDVADVRRWIETAPKPTPKRVRRFSADTVRAIRAMRRTPLADGSLPTFRAIAAAFGCAQRMARGICVGDYYTDIPDETQPEAPHA